MCVYQLPTSSTRAAMRRKTGIMTAASTMTWPPSSRRNRLMTGNPRCMPWGSELVTASFPFMFSTRIVEDARIVILAIPRIGTNANGFATVTFSGSPRWSLSG